MAKAVTYTSASGQLTIYNARIVFEPSSYDGSEQTRRNAVLAIDEKTIDEIQAWETQIDKNRLSSALSQYGLRVKIHMDGSGQNVARPRIMRNANCAKKKRT